jgi:phage/plasmid-associated DNA primase
MIKQKYLFSPNPVSDTAIREYREDNNNVVKWVNDRKFVSIADNYEVRKWMRAQYIYENYLAWCRKYGEIAANLRVFGTTMYDLGFEKRRYREGYAYLVYGIKDGEMEAGVMFQENPPAIHKQWERKEDEESFGELE